MSELIAEARVLVTPDTAAFRSLLTAQVTSATAGVVVPVPVTPVVTGAGVAQAVTAQKELQAITTGTTASLLEQQAATASLSATRLESQLVARGAIVLATQEERALASVAAEQRAGALAAQASAEALRRETAERAAATKAAQAQARTLGGLTRGAGSAALSMVGLRGATLASTGPFLAGAAGIVAFTAALKTAADLETSLNTFAVTAGATADEMQRVSETSKQLGSDLTLPGVTAQSAADALATLARAGLSVDDSIAGVRGTLQLATAAAIDNETAVQLVATALNSFRLEGTEAAKVADLLAASSKQSQGSIEDMGLALQQAAAAAAQAGISVEDTIAILTQLGRAGLRGSDAGTSLRTAILRIINPSKQAKEALEGLGVELRDLNGNIRPEAFAEIATQAAKLGPAQRDATIALIGGQDAFRAISILGRDGATGLNEMRDATQEQGAAAELASARTQGLAGSIENLKNQFSGLGLAIGDSAKGPLTDFVNVFAGGIGNINSFIAFLDRLDDGAGRTAFSFEELVERLDSLGETRGPEAQAKFLEQLASEAGRTSAAYVDLIERTGQVASAIDRRAERGARERADFAADLAKLKGELDAQTPAALKAAGGIEDYRIQVALADAAVEGLTNRIDESVDRFAKPLPEPTAAVRGPVPVGPTAKRQAELQLAQSRDDLAEVERIQEQILADAIKAEENGIHKDVQARTQLFKDRAAAQAALNGTRRQIAQRAAADTAKAVAEAERIRAEADSAFLGRQSDARAQQERRVALAEETEQLTDDITRRQGLRQLITKQIAALRDSAVDEKTKQAAIKVLVAAKQATSDEINKLVVADKKQRAAAKAEAEERREQAREELEAAKIALGESILARTGNKNPLIRALDASIKDAVRERNLAKKGTLAFIQAQTEINELIAKRKEILKSAEEETGGGKTLAGFLTENTDLFNQLASSGGIAGVDPFSGFDFSKSIVAATTRMQQAVKTQQPTSTQSANRLPDAIDRLIAALNLNTEATQGNSSTVTGGLVGNGGITYAQVTGMRAKALGDFWQARQARQLEEARYDGGAAT